jgi:branched-chain amino acid transport system substrate-binding protein
MKFRRSIGRSVAVGAIAVAGVLVAAGCSSSSSSSTTATAPSSGTTTPSAPASSSPAAAGTPSATTSSAALGYHPITDFASFVGGKAGTAANASLSPVTIGVINQQGGSADLAPEWTDGATLAENYINKDAGGIDGHPVKIVTCFVPDTVAAAASCGEQMENDNAVDGIAIGPLIVGNEALESALSANPKTMVFSLAGANADATYKGAIILFGDGTHDAPAGATFAKDYLHAASETILYENGVGAGLGLSVDESSLQYVGVKVDAVGFDPSTSDFTPALIAGKASSTNLVVISAATPAVCDGVYKALKQLNITTPVLTSVPCVDQETVQGDGGQLPPDWYYLTTNPMPGDASDPSLAAFKTVADQFGDGQYVTDAWVSDAFAQFLVVAKDYDTVLTSGQQLTPADVLAAAHAYKGAVPMGPPNLVCGSFPTAPGVCNDEVSFFQNTSPGVFKAIARWLGPPKGYVIPASLDS